MKKITLTFILLFSIASNAQEIIRNKKDNDLKLSSLPYYNYGKGLGITSPDSIFQFNIRFRIQNRVTYFDNEGQDPFYEGQVRRLRMRFDGFVGNPKFLYVLQISFGAGDVGSEKPGENLNVIRDAILYYRPNTHWQFGFGVTKLPGTRQTVNSSGAIQLTDRSINNFKFAVDRDFGFHFANLNESKEKFSYNFKGAITMGEGRNWATNNPNVPAIKDNNGLSYTGKIELLPLGTFKKDGHYFEGDILREPKPKLMVSGAYNLNQKARKTLGQTGDLLYEARDMSSVLLDAIAKYNGWAAMMTYMNRTADDPVTINPVDATLSKAVFTGYGMDYQLSYVFPSKYEVIGRYSTQKVADEISAYSPDTDQFSFGINKYIWEHALKLQSEFTYEKLDFANGTSADNWYVRFQIEVGI
ncbi:porin [Flavobacterium pallidum]|uniref:Porin n=1 Tax=Flavobacterium pallidum TaxID=2172098 RepID=A0A2S1SJW1_9FLAO|nr:porin [Flavobacterium pallidum]AWI26714.1 porin [Flavobacterium pallidum]